MNRTNTLSHNRKFTEYSMYTVRQSITEIQESSVRQARTVYRPYCMDFLHSSESRGNLPNSYRFLSDRSPPPWVQEPKKN